MVGAIGPVTLLIDGHVKTAEQYRYKAIGTLAVELMGGLLHLVQRGENWAGLQPTQAHPRCTKVTAHPSTASFNVYL